MFLERYLEPIQISELEIENETLAVGGYGKIYRIENELSSTEMDKWVVKVSLQEEKINKSGYRSMKELLSKLKEFQTSNYQNPLEFLVDYPPLIGFPEALWEGELDGNQVYCYLMPDLNFLGFKLFDDLITDDSLHENYIAGLFNRNVMQQRFRCIYQLAKTFDLLINKFKFIHGDIKAKAIWIHQDEQRVALIDYDGGHFYDNILNKITLSSTVKVEVPIFGERQEWLAPEILKKINQDTATAKMEVSPESEAWSFACGVFQILTGLTPFAFLNELQYEIALTYNANNKWPDCNSREPYLKEEAVLAFFRQLIDGVKQYEEIWRTLLLVFNEGFKKSKLRPTYKQWEAICFQTIEAKEPRTQISVSTPKLLEGDFCDISWHSDALLMKFNGVVVPNQSSKFMDWQTIPIINVLNEFGTWPIDVPIEIVKKVVVQSCNLVIENIKLGSEATIKWKVLNAAKIIIAIKGRKYEVDGDSYSFIPDPGEIVTIFFKSKHGLHEERRDLEPKVVTPVKIIYFKASRTFTAETLPLIFSWKVEAANNIEIAGEKPVFESQGQLQIRPTRSGEFKLIAKNEFFEDSKTIYIEVMAIPKIDLKLPEMPKIYLKIPDLLGSVPEILKEQQRIKSRLKDIFGK